MHRLLAILLLTPAVAAAQQVYEWTDANGVTHFSSEPPGDAPAARVELKPDPLPTPEPDDMPVNEILLEDPEKVAALEARRKLNRERRISNCAWARESVPAIESRPRIAVQAPDGAMRFLTTEEREEKLAEARRVMRENCD